jgi:hypothetical protein
VHPCGAARVHPADEKLTLTVDERYRDITPIVRKTRQVTHGRNVECPPGVGLFSAVMAIVLFRPSACFRIEARAVALLVAMSPAAIAQAPQSSGKPTELVVRQYEQFIAGGEFLTPDGWKKASRIFVRSNPYPNDGEVFLTSKAGLVGETWVRGDRAEVERKWTDFFGSIGSDLAYKPADPTTSVLPAVYDYSLRFTNQHIDVGEGGSTQEVLGAWEWKIEGPQRERWATVERAIIYVREMRNKSNNAKIKKNANKTIAILERLKHGCGSGSAC